ncbi:hypothetical protein AALO_G00030100 [Alosa alosa]|uniref:Nuclear speckle splicing regulatory protein 1 n=1 Tax=Alosa alosa TaxID=278164 RepID=A0AAV6HBK5_9TELE|nr:hypothetical protein AALO_G00030100 [Alosa alosa]
MAAPVKKYGLILSQKKSQAAKTLPASSVFGDDSDEETSVGKSLQKEAIKKKMMKQTKLEMHKALEQDSSVYEYDSVYDDIQKQRLESHQKILGGTDKKPKYINQLMRAVEERKKEQERRDERKIQKEREAEGEKFADKDAYVTSAYRQKLKEREEELEREKREEAMEAALDVKKQKDLSGFYRHLLNQQVGEEAIPDGTTHRDVKPKVKEEYTPPPSPPPPPPPPRDIDSADEDEPRDVKTEFNKSSHNSGHSKRQYRKQRSPSPGNEETAAASTAPEPSKFAKRSNEQTVSSARERFLARQMARTAEKSYIEKEED